jgi:hypothetical protein
VAQSKGRQTSPDTKGHAALGARWAFRWVAHIFMKKSTITILVLIVVVLGTNAWWAYHALDAGVSFTYQSVSLEENQQALKQSLSILRVLTPTDVSREKIINAAQNSWKSGEPFEKDGYIWVGRLGLLFNEDNQLVEIKKGF